jgi:putative nucleotidyltransferase with HDIG domain
MVLASLLTVRVAEWLLGDALAPLLGGRIAFHAAPHAFAPLLVGMLAGGPATLVIGLVTGVALALGAQADLGVLLLSLCATAVAAREAPRLRHRSAVLRALGRIALWQTPVALAMTMLTAPQVQPSALAVRLAVMYGMLLLSGLTAVWLLPLAERATGCTSQITLNLLADLGHPLLQRLALEAPGTYHHSLMTANLAQTAADRIGANGLLARVGGYYHDVGKLARARFYIENQMQSGNPHDALPPNISRMLIVNHVKEGICLGRLYRLPPPVMRMIAEHHGTSVIRCFHHKAQTYASGRAGEGDSAADESHYRYSGPLPVGRETTILSLADAVEAASRALARITPARIESLVATVIQSKLLDGQLDNSALSNAELTAVRHSFSTTLTHLLHARLAYPNNDADHDPEPAAPLPPMSDALA